MLDKVYYGIATISLVFICCKECYNSLFKKEDDYVRIETMESDMDLNYTEYIDTYDRCPNDTHDRCPNDTYDGVPMDYNDFKKKKIIDKKQICVNLQ